MSEKQYDIIVYGATGFTGQLVVVYFCQNFNKDLRWAIAGRNQQKLSRIQKQVQKTSEHMIGTMIVDANRLDSLQQMTAATRVVLTTVGPYADYGEPLVKACLATQTDYLDITGEPEFVNTLLQKYQPMANQQGVLIVNCCGFDSIPADLGTYYTSQQLGNTTEKKITSYVSTSGRPSGGTWNSAIKAMSKAFSGQNQLYRQGKPRLDLHYNYELKKWAIPMPVIDSDIVYRSAQHLGYANKFQYGQFIALASIWDLAGLSLGVGGILLASQIPPIRDLLLALNKPGEGPNAEQRQKSFFDILFVGENSKEKIITNVSGGDPGYTETAKMVSECSRLLVQKRQQLPQQAGITTPAAAFGNYLIDILHQNGIHFRRLTA